MRFTDSKKEEIRHYILEKIGSGEQHVIQAAAENYDINQNTVHAYINELMAEGIIEREGRGVYRLTTSEKKYKFKKDEPAFEHDMYVYTHYLLPCIEGLEKNVCDCWSYTLGEMTNNIMDHSEADAFEMHVIQDYMKTKVLLIDNGVGIFNKIRDYFGYETLDDAICELFKGKLTTDSKNHSGEGIFFSSRLMDSFYVLSGKKVFAGNKYRDDIVTELADSDFKGTCVFMELSNFSRKKPKDIFDSYTDEDYCFTKTSIPVRYMFDDNPVSRSQAKRLVYRLEKFAEVTLDFDEVEWMGQGFAHQLFAVFAEEHPEVKLVPANMNADVSKMYAHVVKKFN